jgi:hypothetical protein
MHWDRPASCFYASFSVFINLLADQEAIHYWTIRGLNIWTLKSRIESIRSESCIIWSYSIKRGCAWSITGLQPSGDRGLSKYVKKKEHLPSTDVTVKSIKTNMYCHRERDEMRALPCNKPPLYRARRKICPTHAMKTYRGRTGIAPFILNHGTKWRWVVNFTSRPLYLLEKKLRGWVGPMAGLHFLRIEYLLHLPGFEPRIIQSVA